MDSKTLFLFEQLATHLHFGRTAQYCHVTPSTLSRAIQRLESECGCPLLLRDNRNVTLTPAGETLAKFARQTLSHWGDVKSEMLKNHTQLSGKLSLYCSVTASYSHMPELLNALRQQYPQVELKLITGEPGDAFQHVTQRKVDMALAVVDDTLPADMDYRLLDSLPLGLISPFSQALGGLADINWQQQSVIMPQSGPSLPLVTEWFRKQQITPNVYAQVGGHEAIVSLVALGMGVGVVPKVVIENSVASVNYLAIDDIPPFNLGLIFLRERQHHPLIKAMCDASLQAYRVNEANVRSSAR